MDLDAPLTSVPEELKRLVRLIVRGFYTLEHAVVIDMLVRHPCVKEDDLADLLKFERKHLRSILNMLKNDKFLKSRMRVETDEEGKTTRHTFYFINYSVFVNVVKYKLDHMRRKIEMDERDNTSRSSFICPACNKTYTDYEVGELLDPSTGELVCTFCPNNQVVVEDAKMVSTQDARTMLARFNEQIQPIYDLLRMCEDIKLAPEVLEPEPTDLKKIMNRNATVSHKQHDIDKTIWSGDSTRNREFGFSENRVTITMDNDSSSKVEKKDQPIWMTKSTIDGSSALDTNISEPKLSEPEKRGKNVGADDILQTLLVHEPKAGPSRLTIPDSSGESENEDHKNGEGVEEMDSDDDDDGGPMVSIGASRVPYNSITSEMVAAMTPLEKEEYIRIGQQLYENMYD